MRSGPARPLLTVWKPSQRLSCISPSRGRAADGRSSRENQKRRLVPVLAALLRVFYKTWGCSTNLFYRIGYATCVAYSHGCYFKKFTNLPVYPGLTNPYQISLKTKYFVFISTFSLFLPKLLGPTWTSECLTVRRYKKTFLS